MKARLIAIMIVAALIMLLGLFLTTGVLSYVIIDNLRSLFAGYNFVVLAGPVVVYVAISLMRLRPWARIAGVAIMGLNVGLGIAGIVYAVIRKYEPWELSRSSDIGFGIAVAVFGLAGCVYLLLPKTRALFKSEESEQYSQWIVIGLIEAFFALFALIWLVLGVGNIIFGATGERYAFFLGLLFLVLSVASFGSFLGIHGRKSWGRNILMVSSLANILFGLIVGVTPIIEMVLSSRQLSWQEFEESGLMSAAQFIVFASLNALIFTFVLLPKTRTLFVKAEEKQTAKG